MTLNVSLRQERNAMGATSHVLFWGLTAKDIFSPLLVLFGLLLNGIYFSRNLERIRVTATARLENMKDTQKSRREAFFKLGNAASIASSAARTILSANKHPDRLAMIDSLLPSLGRLWASAEAMSEERSNYNLNKDDVRPYLQLEGVLVDYFFMLDNNQMGKPEYVQKLSAKVNEISDLVASLPTHAHTRLTIEM